MLDKTQAVPAVLDEVVTSPVHAIRQVLIVDDTPANLAAFEAALESIGCTFVTASSGEEALARLLEQDFAVVLLDVHMPTMDGFETARWIRSRERSKHVPILFITAHNHDDKELLQAYELGAVEFLFKPVHPNVLRSKVRFFVEFQDRSDELVSLRMEREYEIKRRGYEARALARETAAKDELARLNAMLVASDRDKDRFIALLAQELKSPLAPIKSMVEFLKSANNPAIPSRVLAILERQAKVMGRLVEDLIDLAALRGGNIDLHIEACDLRTVVDMALESVRPVLAAKSYELQFTNTSDEVFVRCDRARVAQAIANLLLNAARYTPAGGRIVVSCEKRTVTGAVTVEDNGIGIPQEMLPDIFGMFVRVPGAEEGAVGLGIGLALAHRMVSRHGGILTAASGGTNLGSTFVLELPLFEPRRPAEHR